MVQLWGNSPKHAMMSHLIVDHHQPVLRVQGKQPIVLQALTCLLLSWEFARFLSLQRPGLARTGVVHGLILL